MLVLTWRAILLGKLQCEVFEIAAYRTANPRGQIKIQPLFVERDVLAVLDQDLECLNGGDA